MKCKAALFELTLCIKRLPLLLLTLILSVALADDKTLSQQLATTPIQVVNQAGETLDFYQDLLANKTVVINFIYSTCTSSCPLSLMVFKKVQKDLAKQNIYLISITVDPVHDRPENLQVLSRKLQAASNWQFITGSKEHIDNLLKLFDVYAANKDEHSNGVVIANDSRRRWVRLYGFPQASEIESEVNKITLSRD
jgi:cytochrome oxidase Cu insertion factor (SCO1/SenC/PrrC family)